MLDFATPVLMTLRGAPTPLETFMALMGLKPLHVVTYARRVAKRLGVNPISRGHFTRIRYGKSQPTEGLILLIVTTLREMTGLAIGAAQLFRLEPAPAVRTVNSRKLGGRSGVAWRLSIFSMQPQVDQWGWSMPDEEQPFETASDYLARLYHEHAPLLRVTAKFRHNIPEGDIDALVHDVFLSYLERQPRVDDIRAYLIGATNHACKYYWRKRVHEAPLLPEHEETSDASTDRAAELWAEQLTLGVTLARLGRKCRETLRRFYMDDESRDVIAGELRTTTGYVSQLLHNCRKRARELYRKLAGTQR